MTEETLREGAATIDEVSRAAGVSTATVSRALRNLSGVSQATRLRVIAVAEELGYVADPSAARLASGRTMSVGIVVPFVTRWFFANVVEAAQEALTERGYESLLYPLGDQGSSSSRMRALSALRKRVDALVVLSQSLDCEEIDVITSLGVHVAVVGSDVEGLSSVRIDDRLVARVATEHLANLGHRRIAHIGADLDDNRAELRSPYERLDEYQITLAKHGITPDPELVVNGDWSSRTGAVAMEKLLNLPADRRPTAVFASSDEMAFGALLTAQRAGLRIGTDIAVVGVDDHEMSELMGLTTVRQPVRDQGRLAAEMVLSHIEGKTDSSSMTLPIELVVRASTSRD